jgi:protein gp37
MGERTAIAWTDHTFNPWWGCEKVSPGCTHCYADAFAHRLGFGTKGLALWGRGSDRRIFGERHWRDPLSWETYAIRDGRRHRVFCASMADVFEDRRELDGEREKLWALIASTPHLDWQLLTKRPENIRRLLPAAWLIDPRNNVWLGTTCEDQRRVDERLPRLLDVPAIAHFVSAEPLLERITLREYGPDWVIIGGESGPSARPFDAHWVIDLLLLEAEPRRSYALFIKQLGSVWARRTNAAHPHGAHPHEWPEWLRVQEFPDERRLAIRQALQDGAFV